MQASKNLAICLCSLMLITSILTLSCLPESEYEKAGIIEEVETTIDTAQGSVQQVINAASSAVSSLRQQIDRPLTLATEKVLRNQRIMQLLGIRAYWQMSCEDGGVNIYYIDAGGNLAALMDSIMDRIAGTKAGGFSLYGVGIFINAGTVDQEHLTLVTLHEYCHYFQQAVFGFPLWFALYCGEICFKSVLYGDLSTGYLTCSWEEAANEWSAAIAASNSARSYTITRL